MSDEDERTTVEVKREIAERLLALAGEPRYEGGRARVPGVAGDECDEELRAFLDRAFEEMAEHLADNRYRAIGGLDSLDGVGVEDYYVVLDLIERQLDDIDVRQNGWHSPTVKLWFTGEIPMWANDAWRTEFNFSAHREHYNGNPAHAVLDARRV